MLIFIFSILLLSILESSCKIDFRAPYTYHSHIPYPAAHYPIPSIVIIPATRSILVPKSERAGFTSTITMNTTVVVEEEQNLVVVTTDIINTTTVTVSITPGAVQSQSFAWWNNCRSFCGNIPNTTSWAYDMGIVSQKYWYMFSVTGAICLLMIVVI